MPDASHNGMSREQIAEMMGVPVDLLGDPASTYANAEDDFREQYEYLKGELEKALRSQVILTPNIPTDVAILMSLHMDAPADWVKITFSHNTPLGELELPSRGEN